MIRTGPTDYTIRAVVVTIRSNDPVPSRRPILANTVQRFQRYCLARSLM